MEKPVIGVVMYPYRDSDSDRIYEASSNIIEMLSKHGARSIGIFPTQTVNYQDDDYDTLPKLTEVEKKDLINSIEMCDGIIKPGAVVLYDFDRYIYEYALKKDVPFLGICGGMQIMAAHQKPEIENIRIESSIKHNVKGNSYAHGISIMPNTKLFRIIGKQNIEVSSKHNYRIPDAGIHDVCAVSPDGVIEAIENKSATYALGLQWHPELMSEDENSNKIFNSFVSAAKTYRRNR